MSANNYYKTPCTKCGTLTAHLSDLCKACRPVCVIPDCGRTLMPRRGSKYCKKHQRRESVNQI